MTAVELLEAYERLRGSGAAGVRLDELPKLALASVSWSTIETTDIGGAIEAFQPTAGWLRHQSELVVVDGAGWRPDTPAAGRLLYGELVDGEGVSLSICPDGHGGCRLVEARREPGSTHLVHQVDYLAEGAPGRVLRYEVVFEETADGVEAAGARFIGFAPDPEGSG